MRACCLLMGLWWCLRQRGDAYLIRGPTWVVREGRLRPWKAISRTGGVPGCERGGLRALAVQPRGTWMTLAS